MTISRISPALALHFLLAFQAEVQAQIQEGDTLSFWSVSYVDWDPGYPVPQRLLPAVCNRVGEQCSVFIDTALSPVPHPARIDALVEDFDADYSQNLPPLYGPIPDEFDNDPRVFILIVDEDMWTGYFDPIQQMADSMVSRLWEKHSSEREIIYISGLAFTYSSERINLVHEFGHMLHWGQDHSPEPPGDPVIYWEDEWIDEAFATFAPVYLMEDVTVPDMWDGGAFFGVDPDLSLIHSVSMYSYDQVKLWSTFMYEHYGGNEFISTLIADQANGIPGVRNTLAGLGYAESFEDTFEHWVLANYLDDEDYQDGTYSYRHYNFPACRLTGTHSSYPTGTVTSSVSSYAADYVAFNATSPTSISIDFSGDTTSVFRLSAILYDRQNSEVEEIVRIPLDSLNRAIFHASDFGSIFDQVVLVVMNVDSSVSETDSVEYSYSADVEPTGVARDGGENSGGNTARAFSLHQNFPNPCNPGTMISFTVPDGSRDNEPTSLVIYDVRGKRIRAMVDARLGPGTHRVVWDGRDDRGESVTSGIYLYTLVSGQRVDTRKMTVLR